MHYVKLNTLVINAEVEPLENVVSEPTGTILRRYSVRGIILNPANRDTFTGLKETIDFEIADTDVRFRARVVTKTYTDRNEETSFSLVLEEHDPVLPENHNVLGAATSLGLASRLRGRALANLLIAKGIITEEELFAEFQEVADKERETGEFKNYVLYGIEYNPPEKDEEAGE